ncbi:MAG: hypothetical protein HPY60_10200 [Candidatus Methanofastidiosum sp.]|nr:hypothetical protein [Methanofastidiosum sp.]
MKVMMIGIDGLDNGLLSSFEKYLPNFRKLKEGSPNVKLSSVFPPDSPTAWASIYTGKNPAEHGFVFFKDPFEPIKDSEDLVDDLPGTTFWDVAGKIGKKVCIIFPKMAYPVWPVNGVMVSRTTEAEDIKKDIKNFNIQTYPKELWEEYDFEGLKPPSSPLKREDIIEATKEVILNEIRLASKLCRDINWDLYFYYSSALDKIQHLFWMYHDKNDPYYKKDNPYEDVVFEFYRFYDKHVIGKFLQLADPKTAFIVLSDHGHGMRPPRVVNINEILKRNGLLKPKIGDSRISKGLLMDLIRKNVIKAMNRYRFVEKLASDFIEIFPQGKNFYVKSIPIDKNDSLAYLSDLARGIKEYPYAGIKINKNQINDSSYENLRDEIITLLQSIKDPIKSKNLIEWVCKREEIYEGKYIKKYPDILFKLEDEWGAGWDINVSIFTESKSHAIQPGSHKAETPVFLIKNHGKTKINKQITLMDISQITLKLLHEKS